MQAEVADNKVVIFRVGREEYALSITAVREVNPWIEPTPVPEAPALVEGVIDLRGEVIPVIDLARVFHTARSNGNAESRIIVLDLAGQQAGFMVDEVTEVYTIPPEAVASPTTMLQSGRGDNPGSTIVSGIVKAGANRLVVLLDAERVLAYAR